MEPQLQPSLLQEAMHSQTPPSGEHLGTEAGCLVPVAATAAAPDAAAPNTRVQASTTRDRLPGFSQSRGHSPPVALVRPSEPPESQGSLPVALQAGAPSLPPAQWCPHPSLLSPCIPAPPPLTPVTLETPKLRGQGEGGTHRAFRSKFRTQRSESPRHPRTPTAGPPALHSRRGTQAGLLSGVATVLQAHSPCGHRSSLASGHGLLLISSLGGAPGAPLHTGLRAVSSFSGDLLFNGFSEPWPGSLGTQLEQ